MRKLVAVAVLFLSFRVEAKPLLSANKFYFTIMGKVVKFDEKFVEIKQARGKKIWIPRATIIGSLRGGAEVHAVITPNDLAKDHLTLTKLNSRNPASL
jgi:RNase P/RNase MRP subunit p29